MKGILILVALGGLYIAILAGAQNPPLAIAGVILGAVCGAIALALFLRARSPSK
jgi:hypothetical protein